MFVLERQLAMPSCIYGQEGMIEAKYIWSVCDATTKNRTCIAMVESQINPNQATWWIDYPRQGNKNYRHSVTGSQGCEKSPLGIAETCAVFAVLLYLMGV
jgi:hypothetical protein